jgi:hypothetical protein
MFGNFRPQEAKVLTETPEAVMVKDEKHEIETWRQEQLEEAGFPRLIAYGIATRLDIDYHQAIDLLRQGCKPTEAAEILY